MTMKGLFSSSQKRSSPTPQQDLLLMASTSRDAGDANTTIEAFPRDVVDVDGTPAARCVGNQDEGVVAAYQVVKDGHDGNDQSTSSAMIVVHHQASDEDDLGNVMDDSFTDLQDTNDIKDMIPAFRCVVYSPEDIVVDVDNKLNDTDKNEEEEHQTSILGLDLVVWGNGSEAEYPNDEECGNDHGNGFFHQEDVWTIENIRMFSPLFDSPLCSGDILVSVNGNTNIHQGMQRLASKFQHGKPSIVTLVVFNPDPQAQPNLVETWVHPSAYAKFFEQTTHRGTTNYNQQNNGSQQSSKSFLGLHLETKPNGSLQVCRIDGDDKNKSTPALWKHAFIHEQDILLQVDHVLVKHFRAPGLVQLVQQQCNVVSAEHRLPLILYTQLKSNLGLAVARHLKGQHSPVPLGKYQQTALEYMEKAEKKGCCHMSLGMTMATIICGTVFVLILLAIRYSRSDDLSGAADAANCEQRADCVIDAP